MQETVRHPRRFETRRPLHYREIAAAIQWVLARVDANCADFADTFPAPVSRAAIYPAIANNYWTTGFWTGMVWLAYELTGNARYRRLAERQVQSFRDRLARRVATDTHDLGFLYVLSCVAAWKITGDGGACTTALAAADLLMTRYLEKAGIIQAWGDLRDPKQRGRMIVDGCMNLPLLYWASQVSGDPRYRDAAHRHARQAATHLVRDDASTFHTFYMDIETGAPRFGRTDQGFSDDSCWSRGQAWGIYGFALSYAHTRDAWLLETAKRLADYFLDRLPGDAICYWDLAFTSGAEERDSSAAAIAACGLLELSRHLPLFDGDRDRYENAALEIMQSLGQDYTTKDRPGSNGVLLHAVYSKPANKGVDECSIWGDYFYLEALARLTSDWRLYW